MIEKNETEIMKNWNYYDDPVVSILCTSYNHENYIEEAIDGFLMQETDFPFEIIIHDDASTDNTVDKIKPYAEKYPNIIKTILQKENQYSQGKKVFFFLFEKAKGKYYAICEGDDYWIDSKKLQIQIDLMEKKTNCYMSFHPAEARIGNAANGKVIARHANTNKIFTTSEVILGGGGFCPTASTVYRREAIMILTELKLFLNAPVGDYYMQIFGSLHGGALYIDKVMSVYRKGVEGAWSSNIGNMAIREKWMIGNIKTLDDINIYLNNKYKKTIDQKKSEIYYSAALYFFHRNMFKEFKKNIELSYNIYKLKSLIYLMDYYLRYFPMLLKSLRKIKSKVVT